MNKNHRRFCIVFIIFHTLSLTARSSHRPQELWLPTIEVRAQGSATTYQLRNAHLEEYPFFHIFDKDYFCKRLLPKQPITFRHNPAVTINGSMLSEYIESLLREIKEKKKNFTYFTVLQNKDFNRRKGCGLLVVKFNDYPFVVKLFIESAKSFTNPVCKGFEPVFFFYMGGGVNRHLSGFTRLKNRDFIQKKLQESALWYQQVDVPRKWFWLPKKEEWFEITGKNFGPAPQRIKIPSVYAIVADAIESERHLSLKNAEDRTRAIDLCNFLNLYVDPHIPNFMIEKGTQKLVIVDTEHFPTIVGFKDHYVIDNYFTYYGNLIYKCGKNMLFSTKKELREAHKKPFPFLV